MECPNLIFKSECFFFVFYAAETLVSLLKHVREGYRKKYICAGNAADGSASYLIIIILY